MMPKKAIRYFYMSNNTKYIEYYIECALLERNFISALLPVEKYLIEKLSV